MSTPTDEKIVKKDLNADPITGEPGAHPVGTGLGAAGAGAAAGALGGAVAGPIGAAVGAVIGAVAGGLGGKAVAESIDPTVEDAYWSENYSSRSYADKSVPYDHYKPAYKSGWEAHSLHADKSWDEIEPELESRWATDRGNSTLEWKQARHASRDAWDRVTKSHSESISDKV